MTGSGAGRSDRLGRKRVIAAGMWLQAAALGLVAWGDGFGPWIVGVVALGAGTAMFYPILLAAVGDAAHSRWRASAVGVCRLWRDIGLAAGALVGGVVVGLPWLSCFGNHEGLVPGDGAPHPRAPGPRRRLPQAGRPSFGVRSRRERRYVRDGPGGLPWGPVTNGDAGPSAALHFPPRTGGRPFGQGFTLENLERGTAYYVHDGFPGARLVVLDTANTGGFYEGSAGAAQLAWLEDRLAEVHARSFDRDGSLVEREGEDRLVVLFSHHGLDTLTNPSSLPNPLEPGEADLPRALAPEVEALLHRFPNVVVWVNGHTHESRIHPRPDPEGKTAGFWEVTTCAVMDWPGPAGRAGGQRERHALGVLHHGRPCGAARPHGRRGRVAPGLDPPELAANHPHQDADSEVAGAPTDRKVELVRPWGLPGEPPLRVAPSRRWRTD